eukprot:scaffold7266_cov403-Prasinococcus_capsulatus_cf.AAC.8
MASGAQAQAARTRGPCELQDEHATGAARRAAVTAASPRKDRHHPSSSSFMKKRMKMIDQQPAADDDDGARVAGESAIGVLGARHWRCSRGRLLLRKAVGRQRAGVVTYNTSRPLPRRSAEQRRGAARLGSARLRCSLTVRTLRGAGHQSPGLSCVLARALEGGQGLEAER